MAPLAGGGCAGRSALAVLIFTAFQFAPPSHGAVFPFAAMSVAGTISVGARDRYPATVVARMDRDETCDDHSEARHSERLQLNSISPMLARPVSERRIPESVSKPAITMPMAEHLSVSERSASNIAAKIVPATPSPRRETRRHGSAAQIGTR